MLRIILFLAITCLAACCENLKMLYKFKRTMDASGIYYYKMTLTLGKSESVERKLFTESKIWANVRMNRVLDIYYKSGDPAILVSKVEVQLIINNTDVYGRSEYGVGSSEFSGFIVLPTKSGIALYTLNIYTVSNGSYYTTMAYKTVTIPAFATKMDTSYEDSEDEKTNLGV